MKVVRSSTWVAGALATIFLAGLTSPVPTAAAVPCNATVDAVANEDELFDDHTDKNFSLEISADVPCADVNVDLFTVEIIPSGEELKTTTRSSRQVTSAPIKEQRKHRVAKGNSLSTWEFKVASCFVCGSE